MARFSPNRPARTRRHALRPRFDPLEGRLLLTAGDLDPTFGTGGFVTTAFSTTGKKPSQLDASAASVQMQVVGGQEKIVAAGGGDDGSSGYLARYNLNGAL